MYVSGKEDRRLAWLSRSLLVKLKRKMAEARMGKSASPLTTQM